MKKSKYIILQLLQEDKTILINNRKKNLNNYVFLKKKKNYIEVNLRENNFFKLFMS